jgi:hypothetical protein
MCVAREKGQPVQQIVEPLGPVARTLLACWRQLPARDCVPDRRSFDPMAVARILPVIAVLERSGDDVWRFRVAGSEIERRWGRKITGFNYFDIDIVSPRAVALMRREFRQVAEWPCGSWSRWQVEFHSGRHAVIETLRLPMRANDGQVSLIVACSEELEEAVPPPIDGPREIIRIVEQRFLDLGAGCPAESLVADVESGPKPPATAS